MPSSSLTELPNLLSTNDPPSNINDIVTIRRAFREASTALEDIISATRSMLTCMEDTQAVIDATVRDMSAVLHPLRSLPDDILSTIFHWCTPYAHPPALNHVVDSLCPTLPPWSLSQVCRRWRALVLSSPILWSTLSIPLDSYTHCTSDPRDSFRLALYLQRSRNVDLHVILQEYDPLPTSEPNDDDVTEFPGLLQRRDFMQLLHPTTSRWRGLDVYIDSICFDKLFRSSFPHLRQVTFFHFGYMDDTDFSLGHGTDGITELTSRHLPLLRVALENVKTLTCSRSMLNELPGMLNLEVLRVDNRFDPDSWLYSEDGSFVLPNLHTIILFTETWPDDFKLFQDLIAPALRTLVLKFHNKDCDRWDVDLPHYGQLHNLSNVFFEVTPIGHNNIISFLTQTASVTALYLGPDNAIPDVLEAIGAHLLPQLTSLRLHFSTMRRHIESVISMMEARGSSNYVASLEEVRFVRSGWDEWYMVETIEEMKENTELLQRWAVLRETMDVQYIERDSF